MRAVFGELFHAFLLCRVSLCIHKIVRAVPGLVILLPQPPCCWLGSLLFLVHWGFHSSCYEGIQMYKISVITYQLRHHSPSPSFPSSFLSSSLVSQTQGLCFPSGLYLSPDPCPRWHKPATGERTPQGQFVILCARLEESEVVFSLKSTQGYVNKSRRSSRDRFGALGKVGELRG